MYGTGTRPTVVTGSGAAAALAVTGFNAALATAIAVALLVVGFGLLRVSLQARSSQV